MKKFAAISLIAAAALASAFVVDSGLNKGDNVIPFHPDHVVGPLANTTNCFPCTFQNRPQVQVWINGDSHENILSIAKTLDAAMEKNKAAEFKAMIVMVSPTATHKELRAKIANIASENKLTNIDVSMIDPKNKSVSDYKVNTDSKVKNTIFVYKDWKVVDKMVNLSADEKGLASLNAAIDGIVK